MDDLKPTPDQQKDFLNAIIKQEKTTISFPVAGDPFATNTVDFNPATSIAQALLKQVPRKTLDAQTKGNLKQPVLFKQVPKAILQQQLLLS